MGMIWIFIEKKSFYMFSQGKHINNGFPYCALPEPFNNLVWNLYKSEFFAQ
jgi:hypothetical protein